MDVVRKKLRNSVIEERKEAGEPSDDAVIDKITEHRLKEEIKNGIQTIQYQLITLMTCNGQAPFVTVFMYLDEVPTGTDAVMIWRLDHSRRCLRQRMQGVKNEGRVDHPGFPEADLRAGRGQCQ